MSFSVTGAHICVVLFFFFYFIVETGARSWVVLATRVTWFHLPGLGCWPTIGLFWAPDLHLRRMLLILFKLFGPIEAHGSSSYSSKL